MILKCCVIIAVVKSIACLSLPNELNPKVQTVKNQRKMNILQTTDDTEIENTHNIYENYFPDVIYPTSILDVVEPFYYQPNGYDKVLPLSNDPKLTQKSDNRKSIIKHVTKAVDDNKSKNTDENGEFTLINKENGTNCYFQIIKEDLNCQQCNDNTIIKNKGESSENCSLNSKESDTSNHSSICAYKNHKNADTEDEVESYNAPIDQLTKSNFVTSQISDISKTDEKLYIPVQVEIKIEVCKAPISANETISEKDIKRNTTNSTIIFSEIILTDDFNSTNINVEPSPIFIESVNKTLYPILQLINEKVLQKENEEIFDTKNYIVCEQTIIPSLNVTKENEDSRSKEEEIENFLDFIMSLDTFCQMNDSKINQDVQTLKASAKYSSEELSKEDYNS